MKNILILLMVFVSLLCGILLGPKVKIPAMVREAGDHCPFDIAKEKLPVMAVRIVDNSNLPREFASRCLYSHLSEKQGVVRINRENEPLILNELARQSEVPASPESIQPIGEILIPTHLYVINEKDGWVEVSLSEIKTGKFNFQASFSFRAMEDYLRQNATFLFRIVVGFIIFLMGLIGFRMLLSPVFNWLTKRDRVSELERKLNRAREIISQGNIRLAGDLLVECASADIECNAREEAKSFLHNIGKRIKE
jgi:hypothetical protein